MSPATRLRAPPPPDNSGMASNRERLRATFDQDAERYDRARPGHPAALVASLAGLAGIGAGRRVLEIGPGTGQLTVPLARLGGRITAVELGPNLAAVTRRKLARFPDARVVVTAFEDWPLPAEPFDAVVSATAFHWIDPEIRFAKAAAALRPGGVLAIVGTEHVAGGTPGFFEEAQACYKRWDPGTPPDGVQLLAAANVMARERRQADADLAATGLFAPAGFGGYEAEVSYSTASYLDTLRTYSSTLGIDQQAGEGLLRCLAGLIDSSYGGRITKRYLFWLYVARRPARDHDGSPAGGH